MKNGEPVKLMRLLEIFNTYAETDMQVKLFSILSGYLMLNVMLLMWKTNKTY